MLTATSSLFKLEKIEIIGNTSIPDAEILNQITHYIGTNIFMIRPALISEEIKQTVPVKEARVKFKLPGTMVISVEEREIAAALPYLGGFVLIDPNGVVVKIESELQGLNVPIITGLDITSPAKAKPIAINSDRNLTEKLMKVVKFLYPMKLELSEIHIENNQKGISFFIYTLDGFQIYLEEDDIEERKFILLKEVLEDLRKRGRGKGLIDLSREMPVFKAYERGERGINN
ncbi:MAG: FtsQ-type POTRA domain-containing protein [Thermosediminibacteraceae bacterium]|nr:FtsQ-type POTRA domain-containing protein [Thermosediminibacteraceae bacterium]